MNNRHTSNKSNWITPPWLIEAARGVLGRIDLDPASSTQANETVQAQAYFDEQRDGLLEQWRLSLHFPKPRCIWLNPPGGKTPSGESQTKRFWQRLLRERKHNVEFGHALFLAFSIETAQTTQLKCEHSLLSFPTCFLKRRVAYINPETGKPTTGMTHSSCITYISGRLDHTEQFVNIFSQFGEIVVARNGTPAFEQSWKDTCAVECDEECAVPRPALRKFAHDLGVGIQSNGEGPLP